MRAPILAFALAVAVALAAPAHANLVTNGNFDAPPPSGLAGWTPSGQAFGLQDIAYGGPVCCGGLGASPNGTFAAFGGGTPADGASISQTLILVPGTTYALTFEYGAFGDAIQKIEVDINGVLQQVFTSGAPGSDLSSLFSTYGLLFTAPTAAVTLTFIDVSGGNGASADGLLTSVVLEVPEPATLAVLGVGLLALGLGRRKRAV